MEPLKDAGKVIKSKKKGEEWVQEALPMVIDVSHQIKGLEKARNDETEPFKSAIKDINEKYKPALEPLETMDKMLRERVMDEHEGTESVNEEGVGKLVFAQSWGFEVTDFSKVPTKYRMEVVNDKMIKDDIRNGLRAIKGLVIKPTRILRVVPDKE